MGHSSISLNLALVCPSVALKEAKLIVLALEWEVSNMHILILVLYLLFLSPASADNNTS